MKRSILAWAGLLLFVGLLGTGYVYWQNSKSADSQNTQSAKKAASTEASGAQTGSAELANGASMQPGTYTEYQEGVVASTDGVKLLFFHAPWCPQCRMIDADIKERGVPNGVTILKVDYDSN